MGLNVLYVALYCMYIDMAAPQCVQRCPHSVCDHPMDDCLVYARKIAWSMGSLSEGRGNGHCGSRLPFCHDLMPCSRALLMRLGVQSVDLSVVATVHHCWSQMVWAWGQEMT